MSKNTLLYAKGMDVSESDIEEDEYVWDDRKINDAYDKAMKIANAEVARRIAMSTNTQSGSKTATMKTKNKPAPHLPNLDIPQKETKQTWNVGMSCRAVYEGDGLEYEAILTRIINNQECVVKFLGYGNSEIVDLSSLKPSLGEEEQSIQIEAALNDVNSYTSSMDKMVNERATSPGSTERSFNNDSNRRKTSSKKKQRNKSNRLNMSDTPPMPNLTMMKEFGSMEMPMAPPPPIALSDRLETEDQAVSSMLLSWYMSGYYTGLYQGMKRAKDTRRQS